MKLIMLIIVASAKQISMLILSTLMLFFISIFYWSIFKYLEFHSAGLLLLMLVPFILASFSLALIPANSVFMTWLLTIKSMLKRNA